MEQQRGERVERVCETGFALNQKLHDLFAQACLVRPFLLAAAHVFSNPSASPVHVRSYIRFHIHNLHSFFAHSSRS